MKIRYATALKKQLTYCCFALSLFIGSSPAHASQGACYLPKEYMAEQTLRFQTQIMVIAMICDPHSDKALYTDYQLFSKRNETVINNREKILIAYFNRQQAENAERKLHNLRTIMANEMAEFASTKNPKDFCAEFESRIDQANLLESSQFVAWIDQLGTTYPSNEPLCSKK